MADVPKFPFCHSNDGGRKHVIRMGNTFERACRNHRQGRRARRCGPHRIPRLIQRSHLAPRHHRHRRARPATRRRYPGDAARWQGSCRETRGPRLVQRRRRIKVRTSERRRSVLQRYRGTPPRQRYARRRTHPCQRPHRRAGLRQHGCERAPPLGRPFPLALRSPGCRLATDRSRELLSTPKAA